MAPFVFCCWTGGSGVVVATEKLASYVWYSKVSTDWVEACDFELMKIVFTIE